MYNELVKTMQEMPKKYDHLQVEPQIYKMWEDLGLFSPEKATEQRKKHKHEVKKETFCVLMPPPNANAPLHCGHATYAIQDMMARFRRMQGYQALYVPGTDHAGFETQVVYERGLREKNKTRFDFDAKTLFQDILVFVKKNSDFAINQLKRLGMSSDWSRNTFMLDEHVLELVLSTFKKMNEDGLIYRDVYLVNYSPFHGTTFSNLETTHIPQKTTLYYVKYPLKDSKEHITVATTRPETIYADVAIAVNPEDARHKVLVGRTVINPLNERELPIIEDPYVDVEFGTGALKITPGHDFNDYEIGKKHKLAMISVLDLDGKLNQNAPPLAGLSVEEARQKTKIILESGGHLEKVDNEYQHNLLVDYKDSRPIEPMLLPNWFVKMADLSSKAIKAIEQADVRFNREVWKKEILRWLKNITDWPISRQIVFGIRIPAWYNVKENPNIYALFLDKQGRSHDGTLAYLLEGYPLEEITGGLQKIIAPLDSKYVISKDSPGPDFIQETDTFDTWFSSGQWPLTTLGYPEGGDFKKFFPTSFMDSMWDILFFWIARMIMFSLYLTGQVPFRDVYIHGRISDQFGKKMSKSRGNVIDPLEFVEKYGADALRMGILVGGNTAARNTALSEDKVRGYRNFANKIWNMARFLNMEVEKAGGKIDLKAPQNTARHTPEDKKLLDALSLLIKVVTENMEAYRFTEAGEAVYQFLWHELADNYIEHLKTAENKDIALGIFRHSYMTGLKLLHPFMPFVTEKIWEYIPENDEGPIIIANWPA